MKKKIETERLILIPLTAKELELLIMSIDKFEETIGYSYDGENLQEEMGTIFAEQIPMVANAKEEYIFNTFWMMVLKENMKIIGSIGFKELPNEQGEVEINYGINPRYWKKGYATEAVSAFSEWAFTSKKIIKVNAEVEDNNIASQKVLEKSNYKQYTRKNEFFWYEYRKSQKYYEIVDHMKKEDEEFIRQGLLAYNLARLEDKDVRELGIYYRDGDNQILAGLTGSTHGNWLFVKYLWVSEKLRKAGAGSELLEKAEETAKQRGCKFVFLDTFSFQAPEFYKKKGYKEVFRLEEYPIYGKRYYYTKEL